MFMSVFIWFIPYIVQNYTHTPLTVSLPHAQARELCLQSQPFCERAERGQLLVTRRSSALLVLIFEIKFRIAIGPDAEIA